jgi:hypothetical protein
MIGNAFKIKNVSGLTVRVTAEQKPVAFFFFCYQPYVLFILTQLFLFWAQAPCNPSASPPSASQNNHFYFYFFFFWKTRVPLAQ